MINTFMNNIAKTGSIPNLLNPIDTKIIDISHLPDVLMEIIKDYIDVYDVVDKRRKMNEDYSHRIVYFEATGTLVYKPIDINRIDRVIYRGNSYGDINVWNFMRARFVKNERGYLIPRPCPRPWIY